jgi:hypothetical protein
MPRRLLVLLALVALAPAGLAACGESSGGGDHGATPVLSARALANVADTTTAKGGMRMTLDQTMTLGSEGSFRSHAQGAFDVKTRRGEMTMSTDLSSLPGAAGAGAGAASVQHMIFDGLTFYMTVPALAHALPGAKKWLKIDVAKLGKVAGIDLGSLAQGSSQDPTQALQYLKAAAGDVTKVGRETVRGEPTTHYTATIDFDKVADAYPADRRAAVRRALKQVTRLSGTRTVPMEVWVGDDGLARRLAYAITSDVGGQRAKIDQRIELYDFGTKVDVKIPSARESVDASRLGAGLESGLVNG